MSDHPPRPRESQILVGIFVVALLTHGWLVTRNWTAGFMPGHEFRQAQTAITSYYIDQQNNFSLLYETPILGKPWVSILMEVPVYEWSVVLVSRATGVPHLMAARAVSAGCFYLMLPALYLLLARFGLTRPRRLLVLAVILTSPVYIFYSRAFLMESIELMCCAWFLYGFAQMMDRRRWSWFVLAAVAGTGAALIKGSTLAVWLFPAAAYGAWMLWRDLRPWKGWQAPAETIFWGLAGIVVPFGALRLWIDLTDPLKAAHASAWIFTSKNLSQGNWGLVDVAARVSVAVWSALLTGWRQAVLPPWLIIGILVAGLALLPRVRRPALGLAGMFFLAQLLFPFAYAYQDYYFYACAIFLLGAFAFFLIGLLESSAPRWCCWLAVVALLGAQLNTYRRDYYPQQLVSSNGGFAFTEVLRDFMPKESVIIVAGSDWGAMIPFYAQRKALMIRNGLEHEAAYLSRAFDELADEDVAALVMTFDQRGNRTFVEQVTKRFGLDATPTFSQGTADIYCNQRYAARVIKNLKERGNYGGDIVTSGPVPLAAPGREPFRVLSNLAGTTFAMVSPAPIRAHFTQGVDWLIADGSRALFAHPDSNLWLHTPTHASRIEWNYGIVPGAYEKEGDKTDGVEFAVTGTAGGATREIFRRVLDPVNRAADRGTQHEIIPYQPRPGELLLFTTRPVNGYGFDWAYWSKIDVK